MTRKTPHPPDRRLRMPGAIGNPSQPCLRYVYTDSATSRPALLKGQANKAIAAPRIQEVLVLNIRGQRSKRLDASFRALHLPRRKSFPVARAIPSVILKVGSVVRHHTVSPQDYADKTGAV
ncbi:MAG TPA: hypothetical protein ENI39_01230 [Anaerolineae bacterium]|nr:hypothetical protein [Anaerolineae bacterium]